MKALSQYLIEMTAKVQAIPSDTAEEILRDKHRLSALKHNELIDELLELKYGKERYLAYLYKRIVT